MSILLANANKKYKRGYVTRIIKMIKRSINIIIVLKYYWKIPYEQVKIIDNNNS